MAGMKLTPETVRAAYKLLETTRPFCNWGLPDADDIKFSVVKAKLYGYSRDDRLEIAVSTYRVGRLDCLIETVAHEMIHVHLDRYGVKAHHGRAFKRAAAQVCKEHGFDPKRFI